jgi:hypothetical protein
MKILKPILEAIVDKNVTVGFPEFEEEIDVIISKMSVNDRTLLLDVKNSKY